MKFGKFTFVFFCLLFATSSRAQIAYYENFNTASPDILGFIDVDGLTNSGGSTETWSKAWSSKAFANAAMYGDGALRSITSPSPPTTTPSEDWIFLPQVTLSANARLVFEFQSDSQYDHWNGHPNLEVKISTTDTLFPSYTTIYTVTTSQARVSMEHVDLSAYAGQSVYIAFVNSCTSIPYYGWKRISIDNVAIGTWSDHDMKAFSFIPEDYAKTGVSETLSGNFVNMGNETLTSIDLNYRVNGGAIVTSTIGSLNVLQYDTLKIEHPTDWTPSAAGTYTIEMWADNLNGNTDGDNSNDTIVKTYTVYDKVTTKRPLLEVFSGSNCSACSPLAADIDTFGNVWNFNAANGKISNIEYQTFTGDPSDNPDATARDDYYTVTGYPDEHITESYDYKTLLFEEVRNSWYPFFDFNESMASAAPGFIEMDMDVSIEGNTVTVTVNAMPLKDFSGDNILHIAVCEKEYTYTGGATSQTKFKHVMRKMLPDASGTPIGAITDGVPITVTEDYTFTIGSVSSGSYNLWVGMDNIEVVAFIQNNSTEEVIQCAAMGPADIASVEEVGTAENSGLSVYPVPTTDVLHLRSDGNNPIASVQITAISGRVVLNEQSTDLSSKMTLNTASLTSGIYFVTAYGQHGEVVGVEKFVVR